MASKGPSSVTNELEGHLDSILGKAKQQNKMLQDALADHRASKNEPVPISNTNALTTDGAADGDTTATAPDAAPTQQASTAQQPISLPPPTSGMTRTDAGGTTFLPQPYVDSLCLGAFNSARQIIQAYKRRRSVPEMWLLGSVVPTIDTLGSVFRLDLGPEWVEARVMCSGDMVALVEELGREVEVVGEWARG